MQRAVLPSNESLRLAALDMSHVMHTPAEERFDLVTRVAARALDMPIALVSLVGHECQWFKSRIGLAADQTSREVAFCAHAILHERPFVVPDALQDARFADNPLVLGPPFIRFYAGVPLRLVGGLPAGTLCVIDTQPRTLSAEDMSLLKDLAVMAEHELNMPRQDSVQNDLLRSRDDPHRAALLDALTGCWNTEGLAALYAMLRQRGEEMAAIIDIGVRFSDGAADDGVRMEVASHLRRLMRETDALARTGPDAFRLLVCPCDAAQLDGMVARLRHSMQSRPVFLSRGGEPVTVEVTVGGSLIPSGVLSLDGIAG